jgi:hypothetical protein
MRKRSALVRTNCSQADHAQSRRNRRHNRALIVVELQCAVQDAPSPERNSTRDTSIADQVWRAAFHCCERARIHPDAVSGTKCLRNARPCDNPQAPTALTPTGARPQTATQQAPNNCDAGGAKLLTREHRVRAQVLTCPTSSAERTRSCGRVNVHDDAGGGPRIPAHETWGV